MEQSSAFVSKHSGHVARVTIKDWAAPTWSTAILNTEIDWRNGKMIDWHLVERKKGESVRKKEKKTKRKI